MCGLYNTINGYNTACIIFLPMLGRKAEEYPRFRDCFLAEDQNHIDIYTRVGGANRGGEFGEDKLYEDEDFDSTFDDEFDNTYATYRFNVPEKWRGDFQHIIHCEMEQVSDEYVECVKSHYPNLAEDGLIDKLFNRTERIA